MGSHWPTLSPSAALPLYPAGDFAAHSSPCRLLLVSHLLQNSARTNSENDHLIITFVTLVINVIVRLIFTFVSNWRCSKLSSEDSASTFFGCFCFWSWWLWAAGRLTADVYEQNTQLSLHFCLVSSSSPGPWPGVLPLQLRGPNYGNGDTNTYSKRMFEQFTKFLTGWHIRKLFDWLSQSHYQFDCEINIYEKIKKLFCFLLGNIAFTV